VAIFNALMIVAFIFSNLYLWDFFNTQINLQGGRQANGIYMIPSIQANGFQVTIGHDAWASDGVTVPTALPISVPNYPFIVFWIATLGNLAIAALILRKTDEKGNLKYRSSLLC
jgi:hypothetical protein